MRVGVLQFPGTNCEQDAITAWSQAFDAEAFRIWHTESRLPNCDLIVVPGGFSYGDYLRAGALAKMSPLVEALGVYAKDGGKVLGICNGFQILCEAGLLPGALSFNASLTFLSQPIVLRKENSRDSVFGGLDVGSLYRMPMAHAEGRYVVDDKELESLKENRQIVFRYVGSDGVEDASSRVLNPNGSIDSIAGVCSAEGNVVGMMPHPERAVEENILRDWAVDGTALIV